MGTYNIHAGHCPQGQGASGAVGLLQESVEDRKVKDRVIANLRNAGEKVYDCTDDTNCNINQNLQQIVAKCNAHSVDVDVSIHLNSGRNDYVGDGSTGGVEVWCYNIKTAALAAAICANVAATLGIRNRGVKYSQSYYVLRKTNAPAMIIECAFVDDADDAACWNANKCGDAIASAILGKGVEGGAETPLHTPPVEINNNGNPLIRDGQIHANNFVNACIATDGIRGVDTEIAARKVVQHALNLDYGVGIAVDGDWRAKSDKAFGNHYVCEGETQYMVTAWEILLMLKGYDPKGVECPGTFGTGCGDATEKFQNEKGLVADRIAGKKSFKKAMGV